MQFSGISGVSVNRKDGDTIEVAIVKGVSLLVAIIVAGLFLIANTALKSLLSEHGDPSLQERQQEPCRIVEKVVVAFTEGVPGTTTNLPYSGPLHLIIEGTGRASGFAQSDAFYIFSDNQGDPVPPEYPQDWILTINSKLAEHFIRGQSVPDYNLDHIYGVEIIAPGGPLQFGIDDGYTPDNSGSIFVSICQQ